MPHQVRAGDGTAARRAGRIPVARRKAGECGRVGCGEAGQARSRDVGKGPGAAASGAAAGEARDDIPVSKELGPCYHWKTVNPGVLFPHRGRPTRSPMRPCSRKT